MNPIFQYILEQPDLNPDKVLHDVLTFEVGSAEYVLVDDDYFGSTIYLKDQEQFNIPINTTLYTSIKQFQNWIMGLSSWHAKTTS